MNSRSLVLLLMFFCTLFVSAAQVFWKRGADLLPAFTAAVVVNLAVGLALYGVGFMLLMWAFKHGEAGVVFPMLSLSYVWVLVLAFIFFGEAITVTKGLGVAAIVAGISLLGRGMNHG